MSETNPVTQIDAQRPGGFDPAQAVPDEYDVLCEGCGYSLVGLQSDKCPECGHAFDPTQLPFARVPWLHRRRIGQVKAYSETVRFIRERPREFAQELLRPVRISIADARAFRRTTINLVIVSYLACALELGVRITIDFIHEAQAALTPEYKPFIEYMVAAAIIVVTILFGLRTLLYLITDLPVFIWRGHPSLRASELSPIQCYAAAPLAACVMWPAVMLVAALLWNDRDDFRVASVLIALSAGLFLICLYHLLMTPLRLMMGSGVQRRRVNSMALYLPIHWLMMVLICTMLTALVVAAECGITQALNPALRLQPPTPETATFNKLMTIRRIQKIQMFSGPPRRHGSSMSIQPSVASPTTATTLPVDK